jgi:hypothetical protein
LFNTARVLNLLAQAIIEDHRTSDASHSELKLLEEAIELSQRCLALQEYKLAEAQAQAASISSEAIETQDADNDVEEHSNSTQMELDSGQAVKEDHWAIVDDPITKDTILESLLALLEILRTLTFSIASQPANSSPKNEGGGLAWVEEYAASLFQKVDVYVEDTDRRNEAALIRANFTCAFANASFRQNRIDLYAYADQLSSAYDALDLASDPEGLCDKADTYFNFSQSACNIYSTLQPPSHQADRNKLNLIIWTNTTTALDCYSKAIKLPTVASDFLPRIHNARGDCELLRYQLSQPPAEYEVAAKNAEQLLKNAAVYYRGAAGLARNSGIKDQEVNGTVMEALANAMRGQNDTLAQLLRTEPESTGKVLEGAVDDGLLTLEWVRANIAVPVIEP